MNGLKSALRIAASAPGCRGAPPGGRRREVEHLRVVMARRRRQLRVADDRRVDRHSHGAAARAGGAGDARGSSGCECEAGKHQRAGHGHCSGGVGDRNGHRVSVWRRRERGDAGRAGGSRGSLGCAMLVVAQDLLEPARRVGFQPGIETRPSAVPSQRTIGVTPGPITVMRHSSRAHSRSASRLGSPPADAEPRTCNRSRRCESAW